MIAGFKSFYFAAMLKEIIKQTTSSTKLTLRVQYLRDFGMIHSSG